MLNEVFQLSTSMDKGGISRQSWHKDFKPYPKTDTFLLLISKEGTLSCIQRLRHDERIRKLRKFEVNNGVSFPAFNLPPMLHARNDKAKDAVKKLKKLLKSPAEVRHEGELTEKFDELWKACDQLWAASEKDRTSRCIASAGLKNVFSRTRIAIPDDYAALQELFNRLEKLSSDELHRSLKRLVKDKIFQDSEPEDWVKTLLVSTAKKPRNVSLAFELADSSFFSYPVNHPKTCEWVNSQLMEHRNVGSTEGSPRETDAYGWTFEKKDNREAFPAVLLPVVGKVILRAMSGEIPCQKRYGKIDAHSFPAGREVRQAMKDSLEWLCHQSRKGRTWADASGACGFTRGSWEKGSSKGAVSRLSFIIGTNPA